MCRTDELKETVKNDLKLLRDIKPLVHNITNYVVMNFTANILIGIGASPIMAHAPEEMEDIVNISQAVVINIGTLSAHWVDAMLTAGKYANKIGVPVILDPVGNGATRYRTETVKELLNRIKFSIIRGNASEIIAISEEMDTGTKGVDTVNSSLDAMETAQEVANKLNTIIVVSGKTDVVTDGQDTFLLKNGSAMLRSLTGTGCAATAVIAAFSAVDDNFLSAAIAGVSVYNIASEFADKDSAGSGPGTFMMKFYDEIYKINNCEKWLKIEKV